MVGTGKGARVAGASDRGPGRHLLLPLIVPLILLLGLAADPGAHAIGAHAVASGLPVVTGVTPGSGSASGGNAVRITGSGFSGATSVQFGGAAVPVLPGMASPAFSVISDSSIQVWATPPGSGTVYVSVTTPGGASATTASSRFTYSSNTSPQTVAIPSYIYPGNDWTRIDAAAPSVGLTVINPNNGPGTSCDPNYATQIQASQAHGVAVLGYVYTRYANTQLDTLKTPAGAYDRTISQVEADISAYYACYPTLDGIFFDEGSTDCQYASSYYAPLSAYVKSEAGRGLTVINPGNQSNECYLSAADILLTFEGEYNSPSGSYVGYTPASWAASYPAGRFWHLIYNASDLTSLQDAITRSKQNGAGWVYATTGTLPNPWGALPADPYWHDELGWVRPATPTISAVAPNNGPLAGGTTVTIHGAHFTGITGVCFGATCSATGFTVNNSRDQITATSPAGSSGPVDVRVQTATASSAVGIADRFSYAVPPTSSGPVVNVQDDGALGNGQSDDTAAFQTALNHLDTLGGGMLYVPPGTYQIQPGALVVHSHITVSGLGATLRPSTPGFALLDIQGTNVTLSGVTLDGNDQVVRGLNIDDTSNAVTVSHSAVLNIRQGVNPATPSLYYGEPVGVQIYGNVNTVLIDATTIDQVRADRANCSTCTARVARGIRISPGSGQTIARNVTIQNSSLSNVSPKDDGDCIVIQDSRDTASLTIAGNSFDRCAKRAIKIQTPGVTVSNNTITNSYLGDNYTDPQYGYAVSAFGYEMYAAVSIYASNVSLVGNSVTGSGSFYNAIEVGDGTCTVGRGIAIQNNHVSMGSLSAVKGASLVRFMSPMNGVTLTGNTLSHAATGILLYPDSNSVDTSGNTITEVDQPMASYGFCSSAVSGTSSTPDGTATASIGGTGPGTAGSLSATASHGTGTVTVAQYDSNPAGAVPFGTPFGYSDVRLTPGNTFTQVSIVDCTMGGNQQVFWYNGTAWSAASNQTYDAANQCATVTVSPSTSPNLAQMTGTVFAAGTASPTAARTLRFAARRQGSTVLFVWRMASDTTVLGFDLYAGQERLNHRRLPTHHATNYRYLAHTVRPGPYTLHIVDRTGHVTTVHAR